MSRGNFLVALAAIATMVVPTGCGSINQIMGGDQPSARVVDVGLQGLDLQAATLRFDVEVSNPYGIDLPILGLDYALASTGTEFLSGRSSRGGTIPARGRSVIPLTARVDFLQTMGLLKGISPGAVVPYSADLGIAVDAPAIGELRVPVRKEGEFPIPTVPDVSIRDIEWESLSLTGASAVVNLDVTNSNSFPIDLSRLVYDLALGGTRVVQSSVDRSVKFAGAGGSNTIPLRFSMRPADLGVAAFQLLRGESAGYDISGLMDLGTKFGPLSLPFGDQGQTPLKK